MKAFEEFWQQIKDGRQSREKHGIPQDDSLKTRKQARERYDATVKKIREEKKRGGGK